MQSDRITRGIVQYDGPIGPVTLIDAELYEARMWIQDCQWRDEFDVWYLTDLEVVAGIRRHYAGGVAEFITSCGLR